MTTFAEGRNERDCQLCGDMFLQDSMLYSSAKGHVCKDCFRKDTNATAKSVGSPQNQRIRVPVSTTEANKEVISNKLFPHPEKFNIRRKRQSALSLELSSANSISKKPLQCPHLDCAKFVGVFDLGAHFKYEHKEVSHIFTHFDARSAIEFSPKNIKHGLVRTMVMLNLSGLVPNIASSVSTVSCKPPMNGPKEILASLVVLATKLTDYDLDDKFHGKKQVKIRHNKSTESKDSDKWVIWLGSNIMTNYSYTIAASSLDNEMRLKYFGPVLHLEENPVKLCNNGRCLLINKYQIEGMSDNFQKNLNLDIVLHSDD